MPGKWELWPRREVRGTRPQESWFWGAQALGPRHAAFTVLVGDDVSVSIFV